MLSQNFHLQLLMFLLLFLVVVLLLSSSSSYLFCVSFPSPPLLPLPLPLRSLQSRNSKVRNARARTHIHTHTHTHTNGHSLTHNPLQPTLPRPPRHRPGPCLLRRRPAGHGRRPSPRPPAGAAVNPLHAAHAGRRRGGGLGGVAARGGEAGSFTTYNFMNNNGNSENY